MDKYTFTSFDVGQEIDIKIGVTELSNTYVITSISNLPDHKEIVLQSHDRLEPFENRTIQISIPILK